MAKEFKNTFLYQYCKGDKCVDYKQLLLASWRSRFKWKTPVIGWLLCGDETVGSSRIHGINISKQLNKIGMPSYIIQKPYYYKEYFDLNYYTRTKILNSNIDLLVFQRVHNNIGDFTNQLRMVGKKSVFIMADYFKTDMPQKCDHVIVVSDPLKQFLVENGVSPDRIDVIPDAVETNLSLCKNYDINDSKVKIKVVWVGSEGHWATLDIIRETLLDPELSGYELVAISTHHDATFKWNINTIWGHILDCDIAVIPVDLTSKETQAKSNNRLTMFKALGLPVICSPLPMYEKVIKHGSNGFLASNLNDWKEYLLLLKDPICRRTIGLSDRDKIFTNYGLNNIAYKYKEVFQRLTGVF